jgi:hypothetical protein
VCKSARADAVSGPEIRSSADDLFPFSWGLVLSGFADTDTSHLRAGFTRAERAAPTFNYSLSASAISAKAVAARLM